MVGVVLIDNPKLEVVLLGISLFVCITCLIVLLERRRIEKNQAELTDKVTELFDEFKIEVDRSISSIRSELKIVTGELFTMQETLEDIRGELGYTVKDDVVIDETLLDTIKDEYTK